MFSATPSPVAPSISGPSFSRPGTSWPTGGRRTTAACRQARVQRPPLRRTRPVAGYRIRRAGGPRHETTCARWSMHFTFVLLRGEIPGAVTANDDVLVDAGFELVSCDRLVRARHRSLPCRGPDLRFGAPSRISRSATPEARNHMANAILRRNQSNARRREAFRASRNGFRSPR